MNCYYAHACTYIHTIYANDPEIIIVRNESKRYGKPYHAVAELTQMLHHT